MQGTSAVCFKSCVSSSCVSSGCSVSTTCGNERSKMSRRALSRVRRSAPARWFS